LVNLRLLHLAAIVIIAAVGPVAAATKTSTTPTKKTSSSSSRTAASSKQKSAKARPRPTTSSFRQSSPTPERYREIQQALSERGYYDGPVTGTWDSASVNALRRFQTDQNIDADGKLGALSLIALGLGPKRQPLQLPVAGGGSALQQPQAQQYLGKPESTSEANR